MSSLTNGLKSRLSELYQRLATDLRSRWGEFRASSIYFQLKALVVLSYIGAVICTVMLVPYGGARNEIGARINVRSGDVVVGRYVVVANESRDLWRNVRVEIDGGYAFEQEELAPGSRLELFSSSFRKKEMRERRGRQIAKWSRAPSETRVTEIHVITDGGSASQQVKDESAGVSWF